MSYEKKKNYKFTLQWIRPKSYRFSYLAGYLWYVERVIIYKFANYVELIMYLSSKIKLKYNK